MADTLSTAGSMPRPDSATTLAAPPTTREDAVADAARTCYRAQQLAFELGHELHRLEHDHGTQDLLSPTHPRVKEYISLCHRYRNALADMHATRFALAHELGW